MRLIHPVLPSSSRPACTPLPHPYMQDELLPTPANLRLLYVTASRAAACLRVSNWAQSHLQGVDALPLLGGCYVLAPAQVHCVCVCVFTRGEGRNNTQVV